MAPPSDSGSSLKLDMEDGQMSLSSDAPFDSLDSYFQYLTEMEKRNLATNSQVFDEISSDTKYLSTISTEMEKQLDDLSSKTSKILEIKIEHGAKRGSVEARKEKVSEDMAKEISMNSHHLKSLYCQAEKMLQMKIERQMKRDLQAEKHEKILEIKIEHGAKRDSVEKRKEKVIEAMAKEISMNSQHLKSLSCQAEKMLEIKIERQEKRDLIEERKEKVLKDMSTYLKEISLTSLKPEQLKSLSYQVKKGEDNFLKSCQSLLSDFVFFMLSLVPWLLYYKEKVALLQGER